MESVNEELTFWMGWMGLVFNIQKYIIYEMVFFFSLNKPFEHF